jgi:hypothetical protein
MTTQEQRHAKLIELADEFYLDRNASYSGAEDFEEYMDGTAEIHPWVAVTSADDGDRHFVYVYADFDHPDDAKARAIQFAQDGIFREYPEAVVNLDTGEKLTPAIKAEWS